MTEETCSILSIKKHLMRSLSKLKLLTKYSLQRLPKFPLGTRNCQGTNGYKMAEVAALQQLAAPEVNAFKWTPRHLSENKFPEIHMRSIPFPHFSRSIFSCCQNSETNAHPGQLFPGRQKFFKRKSQSPVQYSCHGWL